MCETNVIWQNSSFWDKWEKKKSMGYTELRFGHALCTEGKEMVLQGGGVIMLCSYGMILLKIIGMWP